MLEIELKFPLADVPTVEAQLVALGAVRGETIEQADAYFNHPQRDYAQTDEALRIRTVGGESCVTYKGPKQAGSAKTRFELELPLTEQTAAGWGELFTRLGFREIFTLRKRRTPFALEQKGRKMEVVIDDVEGLGLYAEVETVTEEADCEAAEQAVVNLARKLGLLEAEPRSYLEMLLRG